MKIDIQRLKQAVKTHWKIGTIIILALALISSHANPYAPSYTVTTSLGSASPMEIIDDFGYYADEAEVSYAESARIMDASDSYYEMEDGAAQESLVIKTAYISATVDSTEEAAKSLTSVAAEFGGGVLTQSLYESRGRLIGSVNLRVQSDQFDAALERIRDLAISVSSENISTEDVTETVVDLEARLNNARAEEETYLSVLDRATSVEDILEVHRYISTVRETIERYEAQLNYYSAATSYSTIHVELDETQEIVIDTDTFQPWQAVVDATQEVIEGSQEFLLWLIRTVIVWGAILIPLGLVSIIVRWVYRRITTRKRKRL